MFSSRVCIDMYAQSDLHSPAVLKCIKTQAQTYKTPRAETVLSKVKISCSVPATAVLQAKGDVVIKRPSQARRHRKRHIKDRRQQQLASMLTMQIFDDGCQGIQMTSSLLCCLPNFCLQNSSTTSSNKSTAILLLFVQTATFKQINLEHRKIVPRQRHPCTLGSCATSLAERR